MRGLIFNLVATAVSVLLFAAVGFYVYSKNMPPGPENIYKVGEQGVTVFDKPFGNEQDRLAAGDYVYVMKVEGDWAVKSMGSRKPRGYINLARLQPVDSVGLQAFLRDSFPEGSASHVALKSFRAVQKSSQDYRMIVDGWRAGQKSIFFFWVPMGYMLLLFVFFYPAFFFGEEMSDFCIRASSFTIYLLTVLSLWYVFTLGSNPFWFVTDQSFYYAAPSVLVLIFLITAILVMFNVTLANMARANGVSYRWRYTLVGFAVGFGLVWACNWASSKVLEPEQMTSAWYLGSIGALFVLCSVGPQTYFFLKGSRHVYAIVPFYLIGLILATVSLIGVLILAVLYAASRVNVGSSKYTPNCGHYTSSGHCSYAHGLHECPYKENSMGSCPYGKC